MATSETPGVFGCLGLNYRTAPVAVRERFAVSRNRTAEVVAELYRLPVVEECVLLSTCNRTEIYYRATDAPLARYAIQAYFLGRAHLHESEYHDFFYYYSDADALTHLARVASGLDSMVLGETEIFGQLKEAYHTALSVGTTGSLTNRVFQQVFNIGTKVRSSTRITSGPTSVGAAAVQLAGSVLSDLSGAQVLVVGAGEVARTTAQSLKSRGAEGIFVANRSYERALELASVVGGRVIRFSEWQPYLEQIDIVIVSTSAPVYVVSPAVLEGVQRVRRRPLFLVDLSVPRNIDPQCASVSDVHLFDLDTLESMMAETRCTRRSEMRLCEKLIAEWIDECSENLLHRSRNIEQKSEGCGVIG